VPPNARVLDDAAPTLVINDHDPAVVLKTLAERDVVSVLLEGGPTLAAAFVGARLVDRVVGYVAPAFLGSGPSVLGDLGIESISGALRLHVDEVSLVGADVRIVSTPTWTG
jgi:diaminohydroxyphosphoribosylaminopyrimidine deaminase / 5-amino-6-(5-phosphoribosylamino)uracil reductase